MLKIPEVVSLTIWKFCRKEFGS